MDLPHSDLFGFRRELSGCRQRVGLFTPKRRPAEPWRLTMFQRRNPEVLGASRKDAWEPKAYYTARPLCCFGDDVDKSGR